MPQGFRTERSLQGDKFLVPNPPREVTSKELMRIICDNKMDVTCRPIGEVYPYPIRWAFRNGTVFAIEEGGTARIYDR